MQKTDYNNLIGILLEANESKLADSLDMVDPEKLEAISKMVKHKSARLERLEAITPLVIDDVAACLEGKDDQSLHCAEWLTENEVIPYHLLDHE